MLEFKRPKNLVLAGGGSKALAITPAIKLLHDKEILNSIECTIGSSVGGLIAALIAIDTTPEKIESFVANSGQGMLDIYSSAQIFKTSILKVVQNLIKNKAVGKGYALYHRAQAAVHEKLGNANATFQDLAIKKQYNSIKGTNFKDLELTVTVDDPRGAYQIVCSAKTTPNMPISLAMRMTAGLPGVFPAVKLSVDELKLFTKGATEPLVKYDRGPDFPRFDAKSFYAAPLTEQNDIIKKINQDVLEHSSKNGVLVCSDGGIVDNLPIYLAVNKPKAQGGLEQTIAFNFEQTWRKEARLSQAELYSEEREIAQEDEQFYLDNVLNIAKNERAYYLYQNRVMKCKIPPLYELGLLQKDNLLCFDTGSVSSTDFDVSPEQINHLRYFGFLAAKKYLESKGVKVTVGFEDLYPILTSDCHHDRLKAQCLAIEFEDLHWSRILTEITNLTVSKEDKQVLSICELNIAQNVISHIKSMLSDTERFDFDLWQKFQNLQQYTLSNLSDIVTMRKVCKQQFQRMKGNLGYFERLQFAMIENGYSDLDSLWKSNSKLALNIEKMFKYKDSIKLLGSLLSLSRHQSVRLVPMADCTSLMTKMLLFNEIQKQKTLELAEPQLSQVFAAQTKVVPC